MRCESFGFEVIYIIHAKITSAIGFFNALFGFDSRQEHMGMTREENDRWIVFCS
jgi:hypothetical protein